MVDGWRHEQESPFRLFSLVLTKLALCIEVRLQKERTYRLGSERRMSCALHMPEAQRVGGVAWKPTS